jgi:hypothetical protein
MQPGATYSSSPALASDLRKVRRLGRDPVRLEASRSLSFTFALSIIAFSFLCSFPFAYLTASSIVALAQYSPFSLLEKETQLLLFAK